MAIPTLAIALGTWAMASLVPIVVQYVQEHPEIRQTIVDAVEKVVVRPTAGPKELARTIAGLREQVAYLRESADDQAEVRRAEGWSRRLDRLDRVAALLTDGSSTREVKALREQVLAVRAEILEAFVVEQAEDAEARKRLE